MRFQCSAFLLLTLSFLPLNGETAEPPAQAKVAVPFQPFTGKVIGSKVRIRSRPTLDSPIIRLSDEDELFIILGEDEEFYHIRPDKGTKAYVYRKYVIDNAIDGERVNVRLKPSVDSPVIAKLNTGYLVNGTINKENPKWLEISAPDSARFYISKDYVEKVGSPEIFAKREDQKLIFKKQLEHAYQQIPDELEKPFEEIHIEPIVVELKGIIAEKNDFPRMAAEAEKLLITLQEDYLQKKLDYLDSQTVSSTYTNSPKRQELRDEIYQNPPQKTVARIKKETVDFSSTPMKEVEMATWEEKENRLYNEWADSIAYEATPEDFYREQKEDAVHLRGIIEPYKHHVKNRPGDYVLMNSYNNIPTAFLYSHLVNLDHYIGREVDLVAVKRDNNQFAFPAYFVIEVD